MRLLAVAVCVCVAIMARTATAQDETVARLEASGKRLNKLTARVVNLMDLIDTRLQNRRTAEVQSRNMNQRLDRLGGGMCKDNEFNCGNLKCIPPMLVCDYENDCGNNADEHESVCNPVIAAGKTWKGRYVFYFCNEEVLTDAKFTVTSFEKRENAISTAWVKGENSWRDMTNTQSDMLEMMRYEGLYTYADGVIRFEVSYGNSLYQEQMFITPGKANILQYDIYKAGTSVLCGRAYMYPQDD